MKNKTKLLIRKNAKLTAIILIGIIAVSLVFVAFSYVFGYQDKLDEASRKRTEMQLYDDATHFEECFDDSIRFAGRVSVENSLIKEEDRFYSTLASYCVTPEASNYASTEEYVKALSEAPKTIRIVKNDSFFSAATHKEYYSEIASVREAVKDIDSVKCIGIVHDTGYNMDLLAIAAPIYGNANADAIVFYYACDALQYTGVNDKSASFLALANQEGSIILTLENDGTVLDDARSVNDVLAKIDDANSRSNISRLFGLTRSETRFASIGSMTYSVGQAFAFSESSNMKLVAIYQLGKVFESEYTFYQTLSTLLVFFAVIILALVIYYVVKLIKSFMLSRTEIWNRRLGCYTYEGFIRKGGELIEQLRGSKFVIVVAEIRFYKILMEQGDENHIHYVKAISTMLTKELNSRFEIYGYDAGSKFYIMCHYTTEEELKKRLEGFDKACSKHKIDEEHRLQLMYGACELSDKRDIIEAATNAGTALRTTNDLIGIRNYTMYVYDENSDKLDKEFIEMNAEKALKRNDFKVFFQPKYNVEKNTVDGAEALMRWFIPEENRFYPPGAFLPVIESNGFIVRVDHYVFERVCEYIRSSLDRGERVYPVSVNVSRFTFIQEKFADYYIEIKKKYRIRDGLLTIEFTESDDFQDYKYMKEVLSKLRQNGFIISLDDFGTGYASYECLKSLEIDEIKMDRTFITGGLVEDREIAIVRSVIALGKSLRMKVTVEGIDDEEVYQKLKEYGADVIQGYLYSKPIPLADYISFVNSAYHGAFH